MGITVRLETEDGQELQCVEDPTNVLHQALSGSGTSNIHWARTIDWYGDTVFNHLQARLLRQEWSMLIRSAADEISKAVLERIDELLQKCASGNHLYVKFYGD